MRISPRLFLILLATTALIALPAVALGAVIEAGPDLWETRADGSTRADFVLDPIPADFFCSGSPAFDGVIAFKGVPLTTRPAGVLGTTDTIVQRLDDVVLDVDGRGTTRVQVQAMEFEGLEPLKTDCGTFAVGTVLEGEQPITQMEIRRLRKSGGVFLAEIAVRVKMVFTPLDARSKGQLELVRDLHFAPAPNAAWSTKAGPNGLAAPAFVLVDTDANGEPDTWYSGTPDFVTGWSLDDDNNFVEGGGCHCDYASCGHQHCLSSPSPYEQLPFAAD